MVSEKNFNGNNFRAMVKEDVEGEMITPEHWRVPSTSEQGILYDVFVEYHGGLFYAGCSCQSGIHAKPCKHGLWVLRQIYFFPQLMKLIPVREVAA